jgi:ABC-type multidrug transport system fused ATPase/permease subunit
MFKKILSKIFGVSDKVIDFISDQQNRYLKRLWVVVPLTIWSAIFYQVYPLFFKWQIDSLTQGWQKLFGKNFDTTWQVFLIIILGYFLLEILNKFFVFLRNIFLAKLNFETESYLEDKFTDFLTKFDGAFLSGENNLRLIRNLQWKINELEKKFTEVLQKSLESVFGLGALALVLPFIHPYLLVIITFSVIFDMVLDFLQNRSWRQFELLESRQSEQRNELKWRIIWYFNQIISSNWFKQINKTYQKRRQTLFVTQFNQGQIDRIFSFIKDISSVLTLTLASGVAGWLFLNGKIEIGTLVVFSSYFERLRNQIKTVGDLFRNLFELRFELFRFDFLLHIKPKLDYSNIKIFKNEQIESLQIKDLDFSYPQFFEEETEYLKEMQKRVGILEQIDNKEKTQKLENSNFLVKIWNVLKNRLAHQSMSVFNRQSLQKEFQELEQMFKKSQQNKPVLKQFSVKFEKNKIYALVGYNGAGKSTLTKLIKRTIDPTNGQILVETKKINSDKNEQVNLKNIDPLLWKNYLVSMEQDSFLWDTLSVKENLLLGVDLNQTISDDEIWKIIKKVGLKDVITDLDLILGEGLELSGGQKQLLELARVYIQKKPIVILDEGTNQLDAQKESLIMDILQEIKKNSIVLFITHRMTTCVRCDQILVMENGKLTSKGKPQELLQTKQKNLFKTFWELQVEGGKEELDKKQKIS